MYTTYYTFKNKQIFHVNNKSSKKIMNYNVHNLLINNIFDMLQFCNLYQ